jgi:hypothetical protein
VYHVVYDPLSLTANEAETQERRKAILEARKRSGSPYRDFLMKWKTHRPPEKSLRYYGEWPETGSSENGT